MPASNLDNLGKDIDRLAAAIESNSKEQRATQSQLHELASFMKTWRETRCQDHHDAIIRHEKALARQGAAVAGLSGKHVAIGGVALFLLQLGVLLWTR